MEGGGAGGRRWRGGRSGVEGVEGREWQSRSLTLCTSGIADL